MILLDTNIVISLAAPKQIHHAVAKASLTELTDRGRTFAIMPQIIYEFWSVATRPLTVNGLGLSITECQFEIAVLKKLATLLPDQPTLFAQWEALVIAHQCKGKVAHDARLVAAMRTHGLSQILTFNITDFERYTGVIVIDPVNP